MIACTNHLLFVPVPAWGHVRPLADFATKVLEIQAASTTSTVITILTVGNYGDRAIKHIALSKIRSSPEDAKEVEKRIRVISMGGEGWDFVSLLGFLFTQFPACYERLLAEQPVTCKATGKVFDAISKPTMAVVDFICNPIVEAVLASQRPIPIVAWMPISATVFFRTLAPEKLGGMGDIPARISKEINTENKTEDEIKQIIQEAWRPNKGDVVHIPGMQPFYDYELEPQELSTRLTQNDLVTGIHKIFACAKGIIVHSIPAYEAEIIAACHAWLENVGKTLFTVGPLVPPRTLGRTHQGGPSAPDKDTQAISFLDAALERHGSETVFYISFGSMYWPPKSEYVWAWLEGLIELGVPFIFSTASPLCDLPEDLTSRIAKSGLGLLTPWAPQQIILEHAATGWFMSHCGHNSVIESLAAGVPLIAWPGEGDQPFAAAYLALTIEAGFELVQVRGGACGLRPLYRGAQAQETVEAVREEVRDVVCQARGDAGRVRRRNAQCLQARFWAAWDEGGDARASVAAFLAQFASVESTGVRNSQGGTVYD